MTPKTTLPARPTARTARFVPQVFLMEERCTPAAFFVDPTFTGKTGVQVWNAGQPNAQSVTIGVNGFATLQGALGASVDTASPGLDDINLSVGNHAVNNASGNALVIGPNNPVNLIGSGKTQTNLLPLNNSNSNTDAIIQDAGTGAVLNVSNLAISGFGKNIGRGLFYSGGATGTIDNAEVASISFPATLLGTAIAAQNATITVTNSQISAYGRNGIVLDGAKGTIQGNTISGLNNATKLNYGVIVTNGANALINGNHINNNLGGAADSSGNFIVSAAINLSTTTNTAPTAQIYGNDLSNNQFGVILNASVANGVNASNVLVYANNFTGIPNQAISASSATAGALNAPNNFYGGVAPQLNGPNGITANVAIGNTVLNTPAPVLVAASPQAYAQATGIPISTINAQPRTFAVAAGSGPSQVNTYGADGSKLNTLNPFGGSSFTNGVRVSQADVNGDGAIDTIVGTGPGVATRIQVISGTDNKTLLADFSPFEAAFTGGIFVVAGDMNGDGKAEIVVTPDKGGGPRVIVYNGATVTTGSTPTKIADYIGLADTQGRIDDTFRGGARAALGDMNGDGTLDLFVAAGFGGGPRVTIWDGKGVLGAGGGTPSSNPFANFFAFEEQLRNGAFISAGDINGDGKADPIFGGGPGGAPRVRVADAAKVLAAGNFGSLDSPAQLGLTVSNFFAGDPNNRGGVRVLGRDLDGDSFSEIITGSGDNTISDVRVYSNDQLRTQPNNPSVQKDINPFNGSLANGVFVG